MSIVSIVSTQVAPRLHHLHKKEGQFDKFIIIEYLYCLKDLNENHSLFGLHYMNISDGAIV